MGSLLFMCVKCLRTMRIVGRVPDGFDEVCDECRNVEAKKGKGPKEGRVEGPANATVGEGDAAGGKGEGK